MSTNPGLKAACLMLAAAAVAISFAPAAKATTITYNFTVDVTSGPLSGTTTNGSFSYDSSSVVPGGYNEATGLLTDLDFSFNNITYDAATANTGWLIFDSAGNLSDFGIGSNCDASGCDVINGYLNQWTASPGPDGGFLYSALGVPGTGEGTVDFALAGVPAGGPTVSEPSSAPLFGLGLAGIGLILIWKRRTHKGQGTTESR